MGRYLFHNVRADQIAVTSYMGFRVATQPAATYDRFDATGRFVGSVQLPPKFRPLKVTRDTVLGVQPDDDDVEFIVRYRVGGRG